jgi:hypothetical protein
VELYGRSTLPYGSYLEGRFEDYKDPGHLVGKGWMELQPAIVQHLYVQPPPPPIYYYYYYYGPPMRAYYPPPPPARRAYAYYSPY